MIISTLGALSPAGALGFINKSVGHLREKMGNFFSIAPILWGTGVTSYAIGFDF